MTRGSEPGPFLRRTTRVRLNRSCRFALLIILAYCSLIAIPLLHADQQSVKLVPQLGHHSHVTSVAFSPNDHFLLTGSADSTDRLWDLKSGRELHIFRGSGGFGFQPGAFSPDGRYVLTGNYDGTASLWDATTGRVVRTSFTGSKICALNSIAYSPGGQFILAGCGDNTARLLDAATGKQLKVFETNEVISVAFSPDGHSALIGSLDNTARIWDVKSGSLVHLLRGHTGGVVSVAYSPDGRFALTGSDDNTARLWDAKTGKQLRIFRGHTFSVRAVAFSPDGQLVLTGSVDSTARLWKTSTGEVIRTFKDVQSIVCAAVSHDGHLLATGDFSGRTYLWDMQTGRQLLVLQGHAEAVASATFSRNDQFILTNPSLITVAQLWSTATGQEARRVRAPETSGVAAISPDGQAVITVAGDGAVGLWDATTGTVTRTFQAAGDVTVLTCWALSPDGRFILVGSTNATTNLSEVGLWELGTGRKILALEREFKSLSCVAFSPNGELMLTCSTVDGADLWDTATGRHVRTLTVSAANNGAFSPDGRFVVTVDINNGLQIWNVATGEQVQKVASAGVLSLAFSPNGHELLTGDTDNMARLWDVATGQQVRSFQGHESWVKSVGFSPDGHFVLTGSSDGTVKLWDRASGSELATLIDFTDGGWAVVDPEGRYDASDPDNSPGLIWVTDDLRPIELNELKKRYYTPHLLALILRSERLPEVKGLDTIAPPPLLAVATPYDPETHKIQIQITDDGGGIGNMITTVNQRQLSEMGPPTLRNNQKSAIVTVDLSQAPIVPGENKLVFRASDAKGEIRSYPLEVSYNAPAARGVTLVESSAALQQQPGKFYAIVVGTTYSTENMKLKLPAEDAESIADGLRVGAAELYGKENIWVRMLDGRSKEENDLPTKKNIRDAFAEVHAKAHLEDTLLVYLSGHGMVSESKPDQWYYLTADARSMDVDAMGDQLRDLSTVSIDELKQWLSEPKQSMPLKQVVILDTCAAGVAGKALNQLAAGRGNYGDQRRGLEDLKDGTGSFILMGSSADRASYEANRYGHGLLTYALLDGMRGHSLDASSLLQVLPWFQNSVETVPGLAKSIGEIQQPEVIVPTQARSFPVALLPESTRSQIQLPRLKVELLQAQCLDRDQLVDAMEICDSIREKLRDLSTPVSRGPESAEASFLYEEGLAVEPPDALRPQILYQQSGDQLSLSVRLIGGDRKVVLEEKMQAGAANKNALGDAVTKKLLEMTSQIQPAN